MLGAKRWIDLGWITLQPSEFLKPGFAVLGAAILADKAKMILPKELITFLLIVPALVVLMLQPDVGQTGLLLALWGALLFFNGASLLWIGVLAGGDGRRWACSPTSSSAMCVTASTNIFDPTRRCGYQTGLALKAFAHGGWTGVGPGAGTVKYHIPEAHSDFIFAVAGEEFGLVLCGVIALLFCVLTVRLLLRSARGRDRFASLRGAALATVVALQAFINMGVAVEPSARERHDAAVHLLWRLLALRRGADDGLRALRHAPASKIGEREHEMFRFLEGGARA